MSDDSLLSPQASAPDLSVFPYDRVVFFSDAVFAIAMTLLAIELKVPSSREIQELGAHNAWGAEIPVYIAFFFSFVVTALFWISHLEIWRLITRVSTGLLWLCVLQLMFVALMPFATKAYSQAFLGTSHAPFVMYCCVLAAISLFAWLTRRLAVRQEDLTRRLPRGVVRWLELNAAVTFGVFAALIPLAMVLPAWMGSMLFGLIFPFTVLARRWHDRRIAAEEAAHG